MPGIVCAIRGGPDSSPTIKTSIILAKESGETLYFLYVVNLDFLARTAISRTHAVSEEMYEMGEFILLTAQATAAAEGVAAETVVRKGNVREEIVSLSLEVGADYVVLGQPRAQKIGDTFDNELITQFSKRIAEETGAKVILAKEEDLG